MSLEKRLSKSLERLSAGTNVLRSRENDAKRSERDGDFRDQRLERAVEHFERAADDLWEALKS